jgi:hypothetical protein
VTKSIVTGCTDAVNLDPNEPDQQSEHERGDGFTGTPYSQSAAAVQQPMYLNRGAQNPGYPSPFPNCSPITLLYRHLDRAEIGAEESIISPTLRLRLQNERARQQALNEPESIRLLPRFKIGNTDFVLLGRGTTNFPYVLFGGDYELRMSLGRPGGAGRFIMRFGSRACATLTPAQIVAIFEVVRDDLMPAYRHDERRTVGQPKGKGVARTWVSGLDLCADFHESDPFLIEFSMRTDAWETWISPFDGKCVSYSAADGKTPTGFTLGYAKGSERAALALRLENKTTEIAQHSHKSWWPDLWGASGNLRDLDTVYRLEFRIERDALRTMVTANGIALGAAQVLDVLNAVAEIWAYCTSWARCAIPKAGPRSKWKDQPWWTEIRGAFGLALPVVRASKHIRQADERSTREHLDKWRARVGSANAKYVAYVLAAMGMSPTDVPPENLRYAVVHGWAQLEAQMPSADHARAVERATAQLPIEGIVKISSAPALIGLPAATGPTEIDQTQVRITSNHRMTFTVLDTDLDEDADVQVVSGYLSGGPLKPRHMSFGFPAGHVAASAEVDDILDVEVVIEHADDDTTRVCSVHFVVGA